MKMTITVLEDQKTAFYQLKSELENWSYQNNFEISITYYSSGEEFFSNPTPLNSTTVFFLDIQMEHMNGIDVARRLRQDGYKGYIIFLTAFREYVFCGYEVRALNYLLKPVKPQPLFFCLNEIAKDMAGNSYLYRTKQEIIRIPYKDIICFSSSLHYINILATSGDYTQYSTLNNIIEHLPNEFIRTHRSYIVNMAHIYKISGNTIVLSNKMSLQIGRSYMNDVINAFANYSTRFDDKGVF